jgi:XTP/dITP diphosphohydrolase
MENYLSEFKRLKEIMDLLRVKCPWDQKQTFESLSHLTIEETYELYDALMEKDAKHIKEEVGDLFLHLVFYSKLLHESSNIELADVLKSINDKLVFRHPHVFEHNNPISEEMVKQNWEKLKLKEGRKSVLEGVPKSLPSIVKGWRIQEKAAQVGFDWENYSQVREKLTEEMNEFDEAIQSNDMEHVEEELGDLFFTLINMARFLKIDPEKAVQKANQKFIKRFQYIENNANKPINELTINEMEALWQQGK